VSLLNRKRLHDYPWLMFITTWLILAANLLLRQGWLGGLGQIIGSDYITLYAAGLLQRADPGLLYNFDAQFQTQQEIIQPTSLPGLNPFISPPYVAFAYSLVTFLPLAWSFALWSVLTLLFIAAAVYGVKKILPPTPGLDYRQLLVITLSFFPFIEGFQVGQNHGLTLLLMTGVLLFTLRERYALAGALAGLLLYKPQLVLGFLILWLVWDKWRALAAFAAVAAAWAGSYYLLFGTPPFLAYLEASPALLMLPYEPGFPGYLITTLYGLLASLLPASAAPASQIISQYIFIVLGFALASEGFRARKAASSQKAMLLFLALLYPLAAAPYVQLHDLLLLIPGFALWRQADRSRRVLYCAVIVYLGAFFLTLPAAMVGIALPALLVIGLLAAMVYWYFTDPVLQKGAPT